MSKRDYVFRMNVTEEIFEIRSCIEIMANDIKVDTADHKQVSKNISIVNYDQSHQVLKSKQRSTT